MGIVIRNHHDHEKKTISFPPKEIIDVIPTPLKEILVKAWQNTKDIEEIRIRKNKPLMLRLSHSEMFFNHYGDQVYKLSEAFTVSSILFDNLVGILSQSSMYALEKEFQNGFITIKGGHRVGFVGEAVLEKGAVKTQKNIASINIRIAKEAVGCSKEVMPHIINRSENCLRHTLIISPPRCGKTTLLRDIVRTISSGNNNPYLPPMHVGLIDERSEIAACYHGEPQLDVGPRTDILDRCPKDQGMIMLIRSMGPDVIVTDELGTPRDVEATRQVINAGIKFIASVHGDDLDHLYKRPVMKDLLNMKIFERFIILNKYGSGPWIKQIVHDSAQTTNYKGGKCN
ncbi:MAG: stage III sporulation protein AA [Bacillota bacterium]